MNNTTVLMISFCQFQSLHICQLSQNLKSKIMDLFSGNNKFTIFNTDYRQLTILDIDYYKFPTTDVQSNKNLSYLPYLFHPNTNSP